MTGLCSCRLCERLVIASDRGLVNPSANQRAHGLDYLEGNTPQWFGKPEGRVHECENTNGEPS